MWDPLQCMVTSSSEPLEAFAVPNAPASVRPLFSSLLFTPLTLHLLHLQFYTFIYCFSINTSHPSLPTYHYFKLLPFFYCLDLSLVPFFHKPLLTQHKARWRRRSLSQKQAHPDTSDTGADFGFRIQPLPRWLRFLSLPP